MFCFFLLFDIGCKKIGVYGIVCNIVCLSVCKNEICYI